jgi:tyrosinase
LLRTHKIEKLMGWMQQALFLHAAEIAKALGQEETVLPKFRIPYFDPLLPREKLIDQEQYTYGIPVVLMTKTVMVRRPGKTDYEPMDNPLYQFNFPKNDPKGGFHWDEVKGYDAQDVKVLSGKTVRGYDKLTSTADHDYVKKTFHNQYGPTSKRSSSAAEYLYTLFFGQNNWKIISNHFDVRDRKRRNVNSLEGFHDNIHGYMGMGPGTDRDRATGQMSHPEVAG